ncbi:MAG: hypothetical protein QXG03_10110, partial [Halalkalicoccus sp.]
ASRIARKEIGQRLRNIPLDVLRVEVLAEEQSEEADESDELDESDEADETERSDGGADENGDVLPEFDDLLE